MRLQRSDVFGLAIGFGLGAAALGYYAVTTGLPDSRTLLPPPAITPALQRAAGPAGAEQPIIAAAHKLNSRRPEVKAPHRDPSVIPPPGLPNVVSPAEPEAKTHLAGTGFFIAADGTLLTAAHVVSGCRKTEIVSRAVPPHRVTLLAVDPLHDLALLRADKVRPPALLPVLTPGRGAVRLTILGYPAGSDNFMPTEARGTLRNHLLPAAGEQGDSRELLWVETGAVTNGFSGGPVVNAEGAAVGLIKGGLETGYARQVFGDATQAIAIGPGAGRIASFVRREAPWIDPTATVPAGDPLTGATKATVHVLCWR